MLIPGSDFCRFQPQYRRALAIPFDLVALPSLPAELVGDASRVFGGTYTVGNMPEGIAAIGPATQVPGYIGYDAQNAIAIGGNFSVLLYGSSAGSALPLDTHLIEKSGTLGTCSFQIGNASARAQLDGNFSSAASGTFTVPTIFIASRRGNQLLWHVNGTLISTTTTGTRTGAITGLTFGRNRTGSNNPCQTKSYVMAAISRSLTDSEIAAILKDVWGSVFASEEYLLPFPDASGGVTMPTLSAPSFAGRVPSVTITH